MCEIQKNATRMYVIVQLMPSENVCVNNIIIR
jgi:hypothetical protein